MAAFEQNKRLLVCSKPSHLTPCGADAANSTTDIMTENEKARNMLELVLESGTAGADQSGATLSWTKFCKKYFERVVLPFALERASSLKFEEPPTWNELYPGISQVSSAAVKSMSDSVQSAS